MNRRQRGLSLVELMVGITVGLFIVAAAAMMTTSQLGDNRRLMVETQVQQELRAAMDLINRDVRRASGWDNAAASVWRPNNLIVSSNPNADLLSESSGTSLRYTYINSGSETPSGFRLNEETLQMRVGDAWQTVTDVQTLRLIDLTMTLREQSVSLASYCMNGCAVGSCPALFVRTVDVSLTAQATADPSVQRRLVSNIRLPNDKVTGACL